jgi:DNA-binding Xre family transcriptional regulator
MKIQTKELIKARGFARAYEFSKASGLGIETVYRAMSNNIKEFRPKTLKALCDTLFCTPNDIFGYDGGEPATIKFPIDADVELSFDIKRRLSNKAYDDYQNRRMKYEREKE